MAMPQDVGIIDCMIGFPATDFSQYEFIRKQLRDAESRDEYDFPVEYMFKHVPKELYGTENPIDVTLHEMDRFGVELAGRRPLCPYLFDDRVELVFVGGEGVQPSGRGAFGAPDVGQGALPLSFQTHELP